MSSNYECSDPRQILLETVGDKDRMGEDDYQDVEHVAAGPSSTCSREKVYLTKSNSVTMSSRNFFALFRLLYFLKTLKDKKLFKIFLLFIFVYLKTIVS